MTAFNREVLTRSWILAAAIVLMNLGEIIGVFMLSSDTLAILNVMLGISMAVATGAHHVISWATMRREHEAQPAG